MTTNLALDNQLIEQARVLGRHRTKKAAVTEALREYVERHRQLEVLGLFNSNWPEVDEHLSLDGFLKGTPAPRPKSRRKGS